MVGRNEKVNLILNLAFPTIFESGRDHLLLIIESEHMVDMRMLGKLDWNLAQAAIGHDNHQFAVDHRAAFDEMSNNLFGDASLLGHS